MGNKKDKGYQIQKLRNPKDGLVCREVDNGKNARKPPPYPKKIYEYLDSHIIGQDAAKKALRKVLFQDQDYEFN